MQVYSMCENCGEFGALPIDTEDAYGWRCEECGYAEYEMK